MKLVLQKPGKMSYFFIIISVLTLFILGDIISIEVCNLADETYTTREVDRTNKHIIYKSNLDPAYKKEINGKVSTLEYTFYDVRMYGLNDSTVTLSKFNAQDKTHTFITNCTKLLFFLKYEVSGTIGDAKLKDQNGKMVLKAEQIDVIISSHYKEHKKDGKSYTIFDGDFNIQVETKGNVEIVSLKVYKNEATGGNATANFNKDQDLGTSLIKILVKTMLEDYTEDLDKYWKSHPNEDTLMCY